MISYHCRKTKQNAKIKEVIQMAKKNIEIENEELNNIMAEIKADEFIAQAEIKKPVEAIKKPVKLGQKCKVVNNEIKMNIAKNVGLMIATGVCGYFKLMSPILYIPIELVCLCAVSFKLGEYKGKTNAENR